MKDHQKGFLGSFLSGLKTTQLEVNTDEKTLRPIARLKEPRDLFALPKDKDNVCSLQAPRWPIECQVIGERIIHIPNVPLQPEPYNQPTGNEPKPRPVGEENGIVVFNYNPISAVNYVKPKDSKHSSNEQDTSESDSCESRASTPDVQRKGNGKDTHISKLLASLNQRSSSNSNEDDDEDDEDDEDDYDNNDGIDDEEATAKPKLKSKQITTSRKSITSGPSTIKNIEAQIEIEDGWTEKSSKHRTATGDTRLDKDLSRPLSAAQRSGLGSSTSGSASTDGPTEDCEVAVYDDVLYRTVKLKMNKENETEELSRGKSWEVGYSKDRLNANPVNSVTPPTPAQAPAQVPAPALPYNMEINCDVAPLSCHSATDSNTDCQTSKVPKSLSDSVPLPQFSRSAVGGSKFLANCHPYNSAEYTGLVFESRFESGNLAKAVQITPTYYELYLRPDLYTSRSRQWFYFRVCKTKKNLSYRFSIVNLVKSDSLYNDGMRPLMYSTISAKHVHEGWKRCGENICYYRNDDESTSKDEEEDNCSYTLTFNIKFAHDDDTVYFAHSYPYTYSDLQDYLMEIQKDPFKSKFCKLRLLCRTLAGNNVYYLTVTAPTANEEAMKRKRSIVVSARVHPSETPASWMMKGLMDFVTGDSLVAKRLRHKFIFKLIPMLNPDGVIVGNTRNSLTGKDLNRQYRTVIRETYPSIWYTKALIKRLIDECGVAMYCDMHAHSRKHNIFIYGCENKRYPDKKLTEQVFPLMLHKNVADKFSFESCKFKIQRSKEGTGRIVMWMLGITNSYTLEASFGGSSLGSRKGTHFTTLDYEHMGRAFCETLLDYCDENPNKERLRLKIIERLLKEGSSAEEPLNIALSDYSSDEGDSSSSSDNEGKGSVSFSDLEGPCCSPLKAPPCSPEHVLEMRKHRKPNGRSKSLHTNRSRRKDDAQRTPLDMPTTDPGSDLHFSTDDEGSAGAASHGLSTLPHMRRNLLQSDLQRRYIEEIGDGLVHMPPELIITSPTKIRTNRFMISYNPLEKSPNRSNTFPPIGDPPRRVSSMHNLHGSGRTVPKIKAQSPYRMASSQKEHWNKDDLELKLSLKKKIWAGIQPDTTAQHIDRNRPLSWGAPPLGVAQIPKKNSATGARTNQRPEHDALLTACSQKLLMWKQQRDNNAIKSNQQKPLHQSQHQKQPQNRKLPLHLLAPEISEVHTMRIFKQIANTTKPQQVAGRGDWGVHGDGGTEITRACPVTGCNTKMDPNTGRKLKGKRNQISKIVETNRIVTHLSKNKSRNTLLAPHSVKNTASSQKLHSNGNKFKTGGIVVTAVQARSSAKHRKLRAITGSNLPGSDTQRAGRIAGEMDAVADNVRRAAAMATSVVRKVKTKLKKKSPTAGTAAGGNTQAASLSAIAPSALSKQRR